jgi:hypothetical protein
MNDPSVKLHRGKQILNKNANCHEDYEIQITLQSIDYLK